MRPISGAIGFGCNRQVGHLSPSEPPPGQLLWGSPHLRRGACMGDGQLAQSWAHGLQAVHSFTQR